MSYAEMVDKAMAVATDAASAAYKEVQADHGKDYNQFTEWWPDKFGFVTCQCGRVFRRPNGLGQHVTAVEKAAWKAWDDAWHVTYEATLNAEQDAEVF
jgi:hypothetical protein